MKPMKEVSRQTIFYIIMQMMSIIAFLIHKYTMGVLFQSILLLQWGYIWMTRNPGSSVTGSEESKK